MPCALCGNEFQDRGLGLRAQVSHRLVGALSIGLVDDDDVGDFQQARLGRLYRVARTGVEDHDRRVGDRGDLDFGLPDPDRLQHDQVVGQRGEQPDRGRNRCGQSTEVTACGHRSDEHVGVVDMRGHSNPVTQQRSPAVGRRRVDGEHRDAHLTFAIRTDQGADRRRLARAGRAGDPDDPRGGHRAERVEDFIAPRTLDQAQQPAGRPSGSRPCRLDELVDGHRRKLTITMRMLFS